MRLNQTHSYCALVVFAAAALTFCANSPAQTAAPNEPGGARVLGSIRDSLGQPVAGATVLLDGADATGAQRAESGLDGKFSFAVRQPGHFSVTAEKKGIRSRNAETFELKAGEEKQIRIVLDIAAASVLPGEMEFEDKPNFTVAGVTDWSGAGGHGSDTNLRTSESLAREAERLKAGAAGGATASAAARDADDHRLKGESDERSGDAVAAVREFELAASLDPSEQNYFSWGTELLLHRAIAPAEIIFRKGSAAHPSSARMLVGLGAALYAGGSYGDAAKEVCLASDLQPENPTPYLFLGKMETTAAVVSPCTEQKLARFQKLRPGNAMANYYFAMVLLKAARDTKELTAAGGAQELLEKAVALDPKLGEAYLQLGILHAARAENDVAIGLFEKAIATDAHLIEAHYRLSQIYKRAGEKAKADREIQAYREAEKTEKERVERERHEVQQFVIVLKAPDGAGKP